MKRGLCGKYARKAWFVALLLGASRADSSELPLGFVYLRDVGPDILQDMRYAGPNNFTSETVPGYNGNECILKRAVAEALARVQAELRQQSLSLKVYDCYRPARTTTAFLRWIGAKSVSTASKRYHPRADRRSLRRLGYISGTSIHSRGLAVDLTLVMVPSPSQQAFDPAAEYAPCTGAAIGRSPDNSKDMGTGFDCFDVMSHTDSMLPSREQREARRLLRNVMTKYGFENYPREWWHFTFVAGSKHGASYDFVIERPR